MAQRHLKLLLEHQGWLQMALLSNDCCPTIQEQVRWLNNARH